MLSTGSYEKHLKEKVKSMNRQEQIIFTGFISDVDKLMSITDVQANASFGTEATSLALLEGMSLGILKQSFRISEVIRGYKERTKRIYRSETKFKGFG